MAEGRAGVQDEGSQLVALAAARAEVEGRDERWLDLCAGPGGKAALLAALAAERGALVVANERQEHRAAWCGARCGADGSPGSWPGTAPCRRTVPPASTGAGRRPLHWRSARCAAARGPVAPPRGRPARSRAAAAPARVGRRRPGAARGVVLYATCSRCCPRPAGGRIGAGESPRRAARGRDAVAAGGPGLRRPGARHPPAVAAPARHRRDVPGLLRRTG